MIGFGIFLILIFAFYEGARRGTALQLVYSAGFILSFFIAGKFYRGLGEKIELYVPYLSVTQETEMTFYNQAMSFDLGQAYYAGVAFIGIVFVGWMLTKFIGIFLSSLRFYKVFRDDWIISGILNVLLVYTLIFLVMTLLTTIPVEMIQGMFAKSSTARVIVENTPYLSDYFHQLWIADIIH